LSGMAQQESRGEGRREDAVGREPRPVGPLAGVVLATVANGLVFLALPNLHVYHNPSEIAVLCGVKSRTVAHILETGSAWVAPIVDAATRLQDAVPWRFAFFMLALSPVLGAATLAFLVMTLQRRPVVERIVAVPLALISVGVSGYAILVIWFSLMKTHYLL